MRVGFFLKKRITTFLLISLFAGWGTLVFSAPTPNFINYQGFITNAAGVAQSGSANVTVRIYDAQTGGTLLFEENEGAITITNGYFTIPVGAVGDVNVATPASTITDLPFDKAYYITVELAAPFNTGEMTLAGGIRSQIGAVPFATVSYGALTNATSSGLLTAKGKMYFNTTDNQLYVYNGSTWNALGIAGSGITTINGLSGLSQFFTVGTSGSDVGITDVGATHTINIPNAGAVARGVVSTTTQVFAGDKTFSGSTTLATTTASSFTSASLSSGALNVSGQTTLGNASTSNITTGNLYVANVNITNTTSTSGFFSSLIATLANFTNAIIGNSTTTNATITNASTTNLVASNATSTNGFFSSLVASLANFTNIIIGNSTTTNAATTYLTANTETVGTSTISGTFTASGLSTLASSTIAKLRLTGELRDTNNATGTVGQVLATNGTSTYWMTITGTVANGSTNGQTLYWNGSAWTANSNFAVDATGNATTSGNLTVSGQTTLSNASATSLTVSGQTILGLASSTAETTGTLYATIAKITNASSTGLTTSNLFSLISSLGLASSTALTVSGKSVLNLASSTGLTTNDLYFTSATGTALNIASVTGASLSSCNASTEKLMWSNGTFYCGTDAGGAGGTTTSLNGSSVASQTLATSSGSGIDFFVVTATSSGVHTLSAAPSTGFSLPRTASTTQWSSFYNSPITFFNAGTNIVFLGTSTIGITPNPSFTTGTFSTLISGTSTTGSTTASSLAVTGQTTLASASATSLTVSGQTVLGLASSTALTANTFFNTNGTSSNFFANVFSALTAFITNLTTSNSTTTNTFVVTGTSTLATTTASTLTVTGQTTLGNASTTGFTSTGLAVLNNASTSNLTVTGQTVLGLASSTNLSVSGQTVLNLASSTALTANTLYATLARITNSSTTGVTTSNLYSSLSSLGLASSTALTVSGQTVLGLASSTALSVSGQTYLANASGTNLSLSGNLYALGQALFANASTTGGLTVAGQTVLGNASSTGFTTSNLYSSFSSLGLASSTALTVTGQTYLANASSTGGITAAALTTGSLTATGLTSLASASATSLTVSGQTVLGLASSSALTANNLFSNNSTTTNGFFSSLVAALANFTNLIIGNSTTTNATVTNLTLLGSIRDNSNATGTLGMVLQTTGTSTQWVSTSSLGISSGAGVSGGVFGYAARFLSQTTLGTSSLLDNGTVLGINATSSLYSFTVQGAAGTNPFNVASSTGNSLFSIDKYGRATFGTTTSANISINGGVLSSTIDSKSIAIGGEALTFMSTSSSNLENIAIGYQAMYGNSSNRITGISNIAIGRESLRDNRTGNRNIALGYGALQFSTTGSNNIAQGYNALLANGGSDNIGLGYAALSANSGNNNIGIGSGAMQVGDGSGSYNVGIGGAVLQNNTGAGNTAIGYSSLVANSSSASSTAVGYNALSSSDAYGNTAVGYLAGADSDFNGNRNSISDSFVTFLGFQASRDSSIASTTGLTNITALGKNARVSLSNSLILGGVGADAVTVGIGTTSPNSTLTVRATGLTNPFLVASSTGASLFNVLANGNVGIGTSTPSAQLEVNNTITSTNASGILSTVNSNWAGSFAVKGVANGNGSYGVYGSASYGGYGIYGTNNSSIGYGVYGVNTSGGVGGYFSSVSGNSLITGTGNVGIGTTSPTSALFIQNASATQSLLTVASSTGTSLFSVLANGNVGIGTSTPNAILSVAGPWSRTNGFGNLQVISTDYDTSVGITLNQSNPGVNQRNWGIFTNYSRDGILEIIPSTTATSSPVPGSFITFDGTNNFVSINNTLPSSIATLFVQGVSTKPTQNLFALASSTGASLFSVLANGSTLFGTSSAFSLAKLQIDSAVATSGSAYAIGGINGNFLFNPNASSTIQVGNRYTITNAPTTASNTSVGEIIRTTDNTTLDNTVRGIEVVSNVGSNTNGINTGIRSLGATFGIEAKTTSLAGAIATPAAVYAENQGTTQGDALRLYSSTVTTAQAMARIIQEGSTFSGAGLLMDLGSVGGTFTGNFLDLRRNSVSQLTISSAGNLATAGNIFATGTLTVIGNTSLSNASATSLSLLGALFDGQSSTSGSYGMILQTTGTSTQWVSTSSLGIIASGVNGGLLGYGARWITGTTLGTSSLVDNGSAAGINATSSSYVFNVQATSTSNANPFQVASSTGASMLTVLANGNVGVGTSTPSSRLDVYNAVSATSTDIFRVISNVSTVGNVVFKVKANGDIFTDGATTIGTPADLAEMYPTHENLPAGTVVSFASSTEDWSYDNGETASSTFAIGTIRKAYYGEEALGVISTRPGILLGGNTTNGAPVAFSGRVPVLVTNENGPVMRGDSLTISSTTPGYAMKATENDFTIGRAISDADPSATNATVLMVVENKQKALTLSGISGVAALTSATHATANQTTVATTLSEKIARGGSIISEYISVKVSAVVGYFDTLFAKKIYTDTLCVKKTDGTDVCLTGDQVQSMMNASQIPLMNPAVNNNQGGSGIPSNGTVLGTSTESLPTNGTSTASSTSSGAGATSTPGDTQPPLDILDPTPTQSGSTTTP